MLSRRRTFLLGHAAATALCLARPPASSAAPLDISLGFGSLPSAQGWAYTTTGSHAGVPEANVFSLAGSVLTQNSVGQSNGVAGGGILYNLFPGVTNTEVKELRATVRCLAVEPSGTAPQGQGGFYFGISVNSTNYGFTVTPTKVGLLLSTGFFLFATTYDNSTTFHDYRLTFSPPTTSRIYRDNVLLGTSTAGFPAGLSNRVSFGDGTGGANAQGEVIALRFLQDSATPAGASTWGRIKALYR